MRSITGAYGKVYLHDNTAVKKFDSFPNAILELSLLKKLNHPNIIKVSKVEYKHGKVLAAMPRYKFDLYTLMQSKTLNIPTLWKITEDLIDGLSYMHSQCILHRDIKPSNIVYDPDTISAVYIDFGIAGYEKFMPAVLNRHVQTETYRAPEVTNCIGQQYNDKIDVWSLGCVLYYLASGKQLMRYNKQESRSGKYYTMTVFGKKYNTLNYDEVYNCLLARLRRDTAGLTKVDHVEQIVSSGFMQILTHCLIPNPEKRMSACALYSLIACLRHGLVRATRIPGWMTGVQTKKIYLIDNFFKGLESGVTELLPVGVEDGARCLWEQSIETGVTVSRMECIYIAWATSGWCTKNIEKYFTDRDGVFDAALGCGVF